MLLTFSSLLRISLCVVQAEASSHSPGTQPAPMKIDAFIEYGILRNKFSLYKKQMLENFY